MRVRVVLIALAVGSFALVSMGQDGCSETGDSPGDNRPRASKKAGDPKPAGEEEPNLTSGQENALGAAEDYVAFAGFSKQGLIDQLSSPAGDGYSKADATFAANNVDVDWKEEAVEAAQDYLDYTSFSESDLIEQLTSPAGDQFTQEEAEYAVKKVY